VCAVLVLATARRDGNPDGAEQVTLTGKTSKGLPVQLRFVDGQLSSLDMSASVRCPVDPPWRSILWRPAAGSSGQFHQDGSRFRVRHHWEYGGGKDGPSEASTLVMRGRLEQGGRSARGTVRARWEWRRRVVCLGTVRFSAG
jgi:hypothetical protein